MTFGGVAVFAKIMYFGKQYFLVAKLLTRILNGHPSEMSMIPLAGSVLKLLKGISLS